MLDAFIIEELRRREELERRDEQRPVLELPLEDRSQRPPANDDYDESVESDRGVVIIDL